jgi:ATP-binding cassette subfamily B protein
MPHLRRLLPYLRGHRRELTWGIACLLTTTAFSVASPWVLRLAIDDLKQVVTTGKLAFYAGAIVGLVIIEAVFRYYMRMVLIGISREIEYELRNDVFAHLTRLPARYYQAHRIGELMSRATNDMSAVRMVLGPGIMYTANTVATFVFTVALMLTISPRLLGLALVPMIAGSIAVRHFGRLIQDRSEAVQAQLAEMSAVVQENLSGARVVRAYVQELHEKRRFDDANRLYLERSRTLIRITGSIYPGVQLLMGAGVVMVVWLGGGMVVSGQITLGQFVAFGAYLAMLHWPMIALGWVVNIFERGEASMGRIAAILDAPPEIEDASPAPIASLEGRVEFRHLTFAYDGRTVLEDVDLVAEPGMTVAIVGPTGSGKSTLVSLLPRLFDAPAGTIFIDGHDLRRIPLGVLRGSIGFVPQESFLFSDTVRDNIAYGIATDGAERAERAAEVAQLAKDVVAFPKGYDTLVGERGITLSGGQRQRAALARALARDAKILVLDDALASVDTHTEEQILDGLQSVLGTRTTFIVSHRISTVKQADLIVVLREGRIVERGTHDELVALGGFYADLHRRQLLQQEVEQAV